MLVLFFTITRVLTKFIEGRADCVFLFIKVLLICSLFSARPPMTFSQTAKVLVIDDFHPVLIEKLTQNNIEVNYQAEFSLINQSSLLAEYPIIAVRSKLQFDATLLKSLPNLKCIARGGAGMDNIDEVYANEKGIHLLNAPEGNRDAVAEHTIGLLLDLSKNISRSFNEVRNFKWNRESNRGWELGSKTIGLIGFGNTGSTLAKKLSGFGSKVLAFDKYKSIQSEFARQSSLEEILEQSDVISFHIPLNQETKFFINSGLIQKMKDGVVLINTSRGGICKTSDVWNSINSGKIKSFATDVLENENPAVWNEEEKALFQSMMSSNQVLITPHVAGWTFESYERIASVLADKIIDFTMKVKNNQMNVDL